MKSHQTNLVLITIILSNFAVACGIFGNSNSNGSVNDANQKLVSPLSVCQILAEPKFESTFPFDGKSCSGGTTFGAKDMRAGPSETDKRASFSYSVYAENDAISTISLNMTKRPDGVAFFAAEANAVAKMISGQPLPKELENAIAAPLPASGGISSYGDAFKTTGRVGAAKVELIKRNSDQGFSLRFQF